MPEQILKSLIKLSDRLQKDNKLEELTKRFQEDYNLTLCIGAEIEFYVEDKMNITALKELSQIDIKAERGKHQFEIELAPSNNPSIFARQISYCREKLEQAARELNSNINFSSKPFINDYGSSLHFHLNFLEDKDLKFLSLAADSLCHFMLPTFLAFMPRTNDYLRITPGFMAPVNVSFGENNRTTAIRIPSGSPKRIEHRVSSPLVDPYLVLVTLLQSILKGLKSPELLKKTSIIYGNASDYNECLIAFPKTIIEAIALFDLNFYD